MIDNLNDNNVHDLPLDDPNSVDVEMTLASSPSSSRRSSEKTVDMNVTHDDDEGRICSICLENWTNAGDHRICCLKCGHAFGYCCIQRWFTTSKSCPSCKETSSSKHIWFIYARNLVPMKEELLTETRRALIEAVEQRDRAEANLRRALRREEALKEEVAKLAENTQFMQVSTQLNRQLSQPSTTAGLSCKLHLDKSLQLCEEPGCRVLGYFSKQKVLVASVKSPNSLFPGFGARVFDISTSKPTTYIPLHSKSIRDLKFGSEDPYLLSVSLDKSAKIVKTSPLGPVLSVYNAESPLWSCCWDFNNSNYVYLGQQNGFVLKIDVRQMGQPVATLEVPGDRSPVLSIANIPSNSNNTMPGGGIVVCKLNSLWAFENRCEEYVPWPLPLEGPFVSMTYRRLTNDFLVSSRPSSKYSYSRHYVCNMDRPDDDISFNVTQTIKGSTVQSYLSRSCFITHKLNSFVASYHESDQRVYLWDAKTGSKACSAAARDPIMDVCGVSFNNDDFLVSLTEKKITFHRLI